MRVFILSILFLASCSTSNSVVRQGNNNSCLDQLHFEIKGNWKISNDNLFYRTNNTFVNRLDSVYDSCFINLYQKNISDLFGKPTETHEFNSRYRFRYSMNYLVSLPCNNTERNSECQYFVFYFDSTLKVVESKQVYLSGIRSD